MEGCDVGLRVFNTYEGNFWNHEISGYYRIHDRLGKGHGASPNWDGRILLVGCALPHALQVSAQFLFSPVQFFIFRLQRSQIDLESVLTGCLFSLNFSQNPVMISLGRYHCLLKGTDGLHELLHGDVVPSFQRRCTLFCISHVAR